MTSLGRQVKVLLRKNVTGKWRNKRQLASEVVTPIYFVVILLVVKLLIKPATYNAVEDYPTYSVSSGVNNTLPGNQVVGVLVYYPDSPAVRAIMAQAANSVNRTTKGFNSTQKMEKYNSTEHSVYAAVIWGDSAADKLTPHNFTIRMSLTSRPIPGMGVPSSNDKHASVTSCRFPSTSKYNESAPSWTGYTDGETGCGAAQYWKSGFLLLQQAISQAILDQIKSPFAGFQNHQLVTMVSQFPKSALVQSLSGTFFGAMGPVYYVFSFNAAVQYMAISIVGEKERRVKESMHMMGLSGTAFWLSWFITYAVLLLFTVVIIMILSIFILVHVNVTVLFVPFYLYALSIISFSFMITPFFSKAKTAATFASLTNTFIALFTLPISIMSQNGTYINPAFKYLMSLMSPACLALGLNVIVEEGTTWGTLAVGVDGYSLLSCIMMLLFDICLYMLLAWYLDQVIQNEYGVAKHPLFFLGFKKDRVASAVLHTEMRQPDFEPIPQQYEGKEAINIDSIVKIYPKSSENKEEVLAVNGVDLSIYQDEIFALLGHNGAGKSTLISILCGLFPQSGGQIHIFGMDIATQMDEIRSHMGWCPQHDVLIPKLTVKEHIELFGGIKGLQDSELAMAVDHLLNLTDLSEAANVDAAVLSGGQKRKLSVAMALVGNPKILVLDEPTSGMDPYSRRKLWDLLQSQREGRCILLTTHFMEEADILADRKAIMSKGRIMCVGSSLFLKHRFGIGYHLNVVQSTDEAEGPEVFNFVEGQLPGSTELRRIGNTVDIGLPTDATTRFASFFTALEENKDNLQVESYGLSMPTLEEVFVKLEDMEGETLANLSIRTTEDDIKKSAVTYPEPDCEDLHPTAMKKVKALAKIYIRAYMLEKKALFFMIILPLVMAISGIVLIKVVDNPVAAAEKILSLSPSMYTKSPLWVSPYTNASGTLTDLEDVLRDSSHWNLSPLPSNTTFDKFMLDYASQSASLKHPYSVGVRYDHIPQLDKPGNLSWVLYFNDSFVHAMPIWMNQLINSVAQVKSNYTYPPLEISSHPFAEAHRSFDVISYVAIMMLGMSLSIQAGVFGISIVKESETKVKHLLWVSGVTSSVYWTAHFIVDIVIYALPAVGLVIVVQAFQLESFVGAATLPFIMVIILYLPNMIMFCYCTSYLFEKAETYQSSMPALVSMASIFPYYAISGLALGGKPEVAAIIHIICSIAIPPYTIMGGFFYVYWVSSQAIFDPMAGPITFSSYFKTDNHNQYLSTLLIMLGDTVFFAGLMIFLDYYRYRADVKDNTQGNEDNRQVRHEDPLVQREYERVKGIKYDGNTNGTAQQATGSRNPNDKGASRPLLAGSKGHSHHDVIIATGLRKSFKREVGQDGGRCNKKVEDKVVVHDLTFGIPENEIFGLLGPNGAGKTTSLSMLTGFLKPNAGGAIVDGYSVQLDSANAFQRMGYCPQFDALWEAATGRQVLEAYAAIRGMDTSTAKKMAASLLSQMGITEHADKVTKKYSGGTQRKLSFAIAMVGGPRVVFLDEPSTGMDPASRRFMWGVIQTKMQGRCAILTTHSMEEADVLCGRIGIMVNGKLKCLGSSQQLKHRYASSFVLEIKTLVDDRIPAIKAFVAKLFGDPALEEEYAGRMKWSVPNKQDGTAQHNYADIFQAMESSKEDLAIQEYSYSQSTLEQVFLAIAKQQQTDATAPHVENEQPQAQNYQQQSTAGSMV